MSSEWPTLPIGELAAKTPGALAVGPFGSRMKADLYSPSGVRVIRGNNLGTGLELKGDFVHVPPDVADGLASCCLVPGDLVFPHRGNIGEVGITPDDEHRYMLSTSLMKLSPDRARVDPLFLTYYFKSNIGRAALLMNASQVGTPGIATPLKSLRSIELPLPTLAEQQVISRLLSELDKRIALLRETNATLEAIAQALFKSWFVDFDPVRAKLAGLAPEGMDEATAVLFPDTFEESALGLVPKGWGTSTLGAQTSAHGGTIQTGPFGSQLHASDYADQGVPVAMPKDILDRRISTASVARVSNEHVSRLARHKLTPGDIVFSRRGDVERHALVTGYEAGWLCGTGCLLVRPGASWRWPAYLSMLLDAPYAKAWLVQHAVGATMPNLNTGILGSIPVIVVPADILDQYEQVAMAVETKRSENMAMLQTLATLRDTLLPRLISGQLRLPEACLDLVQIPKQHRDMA